MKIFTKQYIITLSVVFTFVFLLTSVAQAIAQPPSPLPRDENRVPLQSTYFDVISGRKAVTASTTAEALFSTVTPCKNITVVALLANTTAIYVGGTSTEALSGSQMGIPLNAGDSYTLGAEDCADVYVDVLTDGEGVTFTYLK
jgi:hypothetical protein|tara:strand:+ start:10030 stop:10458 length:429 start_codon:yes stop_codon:yes gene_type:complete